MLHFNSGLASSEAPLDGSLFSVTLGFQGLYFLHKSSFICDPTFKGHAIKDTDLDLCHIQPTSVFGREMKLYSFQYSSRFSRFEGFIQRGWTVRVEVILHHHNLFSLAILFID